MAEHLVILPARARRRLESKRVLVWRRRRREAPLGRVTAGDRVFVKHPGGWVLSVGTVGRVREERRDGTYVLTLTLRRCARLAVPFPILKRDRRSWVVCARSSDERQTRLFAEPALSLPALLARVRAHHAPLPSRRVVRNLLAALCGDRPGDSSRLLWLALLVAAHEAPDIPARLAAYLKKPPRAVFPFAAFS